MIKAGIIGFILVSALGAIIGIQQRALEKARTEREQAIQFSNSKSDSLEYLETKLGQASAKSDVLDLTIRNLRQLQQDKDLAWIKQIEGINKRMNNVEQIVSTTARAVGTFRIGLKDTVINIVPVDSAAAPNSVRSLAFDNHNKWFRLKGFIMPDTLVVTPEIYVPLQSVVYWERKRFLGLKIGRKDWFKQTTSPNPYVKITEDKLIRVSKHKPK